MAFVLSSGINRCALLLWDTREGTAGFCERKKITLYVMKYLEEFHGQVILF